MGQTTRAARRPPSDAPSDAVRVVVPPAELHERLVRLGGEAAPKSGQPWRERLRRMLREPRGRRSLAHLAVVALPLVLSLILLLLGLPGDASLGW
jgi:hypothetical protein